MSNESRLTIVASASPIPSHPSTAGIDEVIESLKFLAIGDHVRVIRAHDAPRSRKNPRGAMAYREYLEKLRLKYSEQLERHGLFREIENRLAQSSESVSLVDSWSVLCSEESCSQADNNGVFIYSDHDYLSPEGAALLVPLISDAVQHVRVD